MLLFFHIFEGVDTFAFKCPLLINLRHFFYFIFKTKKIFCQSITIYTQTEIRYGSGFVWQTKMTDLQSVNAITSTCQLIMRNIVQLRKSSSLP